MNTDDTPDAETDTASSGPSKERLGPGSPSSSVFTRGVRQLLVIKEELSSEWSPNLDQEDRGYIHIKEEQEELWTSQEGQQLNELEGADSTRLPFTTVTMKSEDDEEKPQTSLLHQSLIKDTRQAEPPASSSATQIKTEIDGEDCGGSEPARNQDAGVRLQFVIKEEVPPEQCCSQDKEDIEPLHVKEEQEELWTNQEGEMLNGTEEADITRFTFTAVTVKSKDNEEKPQDSQHHQSQTEDNRGAEPPASRSTTQIKTETDGGESGGSEPARSRVPDGHHQLNTDDTSAKQFGCGNCGKRFTRQGALEAHMRVHTGQKPFGCNVCGKCFTQKSSLKIHMRVHTGEKPFVCDVCGKGFIQQSHLNRHMRVHTGEKPFACGHCGENFTRQGNLKKHMRVHTGEKPFGCDVCGKRLIQRRYLKLHMRVHTGDKCV